MGNVSADPEASQSRITAIAAQCKGLRLQLSDSIYRCAAISDELSSAKSHLAAALKREAEFQRVRRDLDQALSIAAKDFQHVSEERQDIRHQVSLLREAILKLDSCLSTRVRGRSATRF